MDQSHTVWPSRSYWPNLAEKYNVSFHGTTVTEKKVLEHAEEALQSEDGLQAIADYEQVSRSSKTHTLHMAPAFLWHLPTYGTYLWHLWRRFALTAGTEERGTTRDGKLRQGPYLL